MSEELNAAELKEVVERARAGSLVDFQHIYSAYSKAIYNFLWRLTGSEADAEDLVQDTFLKAFAELSNLRDVGQFRFWLYRIARNEVYQRARKKQRRPEVSIEDEEKSFLDFVPDASAGLDPEKAVLSRELNEVIARTLRAMKPKYRDVFILAVFEKMSYEEITGVVGRSLLSVKTDIYRARLMMKDALGKYLSHGL